MATTVKVVAPPTPPVQTGGGSGRLLVGLFLIAVATGLGIAYVSSRKKKDGVNQGLANSFTPDVTTPAPTPSPEATAPSTSTGGGGYTGGSGSSCPLPADQVLPFQQFANKKGAGLVEDGKCGPKTTAAYAKYGAAFLAGKGTSSGSALGKKVYVADKYISVNIYSEPRINNSAWLDSTIIGKINSPNVVGKVTAEAISQFDKKKWYQLSLLTAPSVIQGNPSSNPYATVGWVRADVVTPK